MLEDYSIAFPNLGIELEHVGKSIEVFGLELAFYGMVIALGMLLGVSLACHEAKRIGLNEDHYFSMALISIVSGIVGARLYFVIFSWEDYKDNLLEIFNIRGGGLAIYGGILGAILAAFIYTKIRKMGFLRVLDTMCFGVLVGQILGRWGNFFNREAFGGYTDGLFAMRLPERAVRASDITAEMREHMVDGFIQVHPTFLYESLWNLAVLVFLLLYRKHKKFDGELIFIYLLGYGAGRFWIEGLRTDQLLLPGIGLPASQVLSGILVLISILGLTVGYLKKAGKWGKKQ